MAKMKVHELAKKLNISSKEIISVAENLHIDVKSHLSAIGEDDAQKIEKNFNTKSKSVEKSESKKIEKKASKEHMEKKEKKEHKKEEEAIPVIIRREVIVDEEKEIKQKEQVRTAERKNNVGFVERKQNHDYNLVYRNKPNKPMTVNELFGISKNKEKEEPKEEQKVIESKMEQVEKTVKKHEIKKDEIKEDKKIEKKEIEKERVEEIKTVEAKQSNNNVSEEKRVNSSENRNTYNNNRDSNGYRNNNYRNNNQNGNGGYNRDNNRDNSGYRNNNGNNNYRNNNQNGNGGYNRDNNRDNNGYRNNNGNNNYRNNNQNGNGGYNRDNNRDNNGYRNNNGNNNYRNNNNQNGNNNRFGRGPLDEKGLEKNIKNIIAVETIEKENVREYNKHIDKQKNQKLEEVKSAAKKAKTKKGGFNEGIDEGKLKSLKQTNKLSNMFEDSNGGMLDYYDLSTNRGRKRKTKQHKNSQEKSRQKIFQLTEVEITDPISVKAFATEMKKTTADVIKKLLGYGIMATINNDIDFDTAFLIAGEFGITATKKEVVTEEDILFDDSEDKEEELITRPPVIVVMGHVDHGKTSLLDAIRKTNVIEGEAGGITQAIGAYKVKVENREITFLDTPGHEAFTSMRARGAQITDIAILVVAANDGVKPQTIEAINHAKSADIPIIVAVNKIDLPDANIDKVKQELMAYELVPEEWGGETIYVPISAKQNQNIDKLLEMVLLQSDVLELRTNPNKQAKGAVIEARLDKSKGTVATMLVQRGRLDIGDTIVVGSSIGRIRDMKDDKGRSVKHAGPSTPVEIMGLTDVPQAGDVFYEVKNEKVAKNLIERRKRQNREETINSGTKITLDNLFSQMEEGNLKALNLIVKADVQGSVEAVKQSLEKLANEEVKVKVIHSAAGAVNQSDVTLAKVSNAIIIAFNVRPDNTARELAEKDEIQIKQYSVIYQAIEDVEAAMTGMLSPKFEEKVIGNVEVRQVFKISNVGTIAGSFVLSGKVERNAGVRVIRENVVLHEGKLCTLKRFKDDVKEVSKGFECGIQVEDYNDIKEGDIIEVYIMEEIKRK